MNIQPNNAAGEIPAKTWTKRLAWAIPLFFLLKGLLWLAVPALFLLFSLE